MKNSMGQYSSLPIITPIITITNNKTYHITKLNSPVFHGIKRASKQFKVKPLLVGLSNDWIPTGLKSVWIRFDFIRVGLEFGLTG